MRFSIALSVFAYLQVLFFNAFAFGAELTETATLTPSNENCDFYLKLESKRNCQTALEQPSNYLLSYGHKYCERYLNLSYEWGGRLKQWTLDTMLCLQNELWKNEQQIESCLTLEAFAFSTHSSCYVSNGFCELPMRDRIEILRQLNCIDLLFMPAQSIVQGLSLIDHCISDIDFSELVADACVIM